MKITAAVTLIFICLMALGVVCVRPIKAQYKGDITINADGSVNPSAAPIKQDGNVYTLESDVNGFITVNRNNMIFDGNGHTITYGGDNPPSWRIYAFCLGASNDTVKNLTIVGGWYGITVGGNSNVVANNTITQTGTPLPFNPEGGINVDGGNLNAIISNDLLNNDVGMRFSETNNTLIARNTIENSSSLAIVFWGGSNNAVYHNNFVNNANQVFMDDFDFHTSGNVWDDGYPLGGNYWSDYSAKYPNATEVDSSGIGNTVYVIKAYSWQPNSENKDRYPLMEPFTSATYLLQTTPPKISALSPLNQTYVSLNISLVVAVDKPVSWTGYSLDGKQNVTINGNTNLTGLSSGQHSITVYANDTFGNMGASTVSFTVAKPFPIVTVAAVSGAIVVVVVATGLLVYFKKRKR